MFRNMVAFILSVVLVFLVGCTYNKSSVMVLSEKSTSDSVSLTSNIPYTKGNEKLSNYSLFVNGKEMSDNNYVKINNQCKNTELPLLAILEELGATVIWENHNTVVVEFKDTKFSIDTKKELFGISIPPGTVGAIRQVVNQEIIIDGESIRGLLCNVMNAEIFVDYENSIVYVNSLE